MEWSPARTGGETGIVGGLQAAGSAVREMHEEVEATPRSLIPQPQLLVGRRRGVEIRVLRAKRLTSRASQDFIRTDEGFNIGGGEVIHQPPQNSFKALSRKQGSQSGTALAVTSPGHARSPSRPLLCRQTALLVTPCNETADACVLEASGQGPFVTR